MFSLKARDAVKTSLEYQAVMLTLVTVARQCELVFMDQIVGSVIRCKQ